MTAASGIMDVSLRQCGFQIHEKRLPRCLCVCVMSHRGAAERRYSPSTSSVTQPSWKAKHDYPAPSGELLELMFVLWKLLLKNYRANWSAGNLQGRWRKGVAETENCKRTKLLVAVQFCGERMFIWMQHFCIFHYLQQYLRLFFLFLHSVSLCKITQAEIQNIFRKVVMHFNKSSGRKM